MIVELTIAVFSAALSSLFTLAAVWWLYERRLRPGLESLLERRIEELGRVIEERVRKGTLEAIASIPSPEVLRDATRTMTRTGVSFLEALLGTRREDGDQE